MKSHKKPGFHPLFKRYTFRKTTEVIRIFLRVKTEEIGKKEFRIFLLFTQLGIFWYWKCLCVILKLCERYLTSILDVILDVRRFLSYLMSWSLLLPLKILAVSKLQLTAEIYVWEYINENLFSVFSAIIRTQKKIDHVLLFCFFFNWDSLHARLNSHYETWSYKKRSTKKIAGYRKSV